MSVPVDLDLLALDLDGVLTLPGEPGWDQARRAWNLAVDQQPVAVATVTSVRDVRTVVTAARRLGLRVAAQSTGHNASPMGDLAGTILLRLSELRGVTVDPSARVARVEGGAQWAEVTSAAARHGLAALAGSSGDVGVAGYTLGGGVSWLGRSHGLALNHVRAFEVVTADGAVRRVDAEHHPDLFWALRGGGRSGPAGPCRAAPGQLPSPATAWFRASSPSTAAGDADVWLARSGTIRPLRRRTARPR